jgi:hypothetical protein
VTPEEAFAEYRKTRPTFDVKPAFVDGWRMGREATLREVRLAIMGVLDSLQADAEAKRDSFGVKSAKVAGATRALNAVRALLGRDA